MNILVLGGTKFVGRHIADAVLAQGHSLTLFHRGQTNPDLFPDAEHLLGDRDGHLHALSGRTWDAIIDVNGYVPRIVRQSLHALRAATPRYAFISTVSVYADMRVPGQDEDAPLHAPLDTDEVTGKSYGPLKAGCEQAVREAFPAGNLIIRPGLVAGPHDPTDRFTYWPVRAAQGGNMLAPGDPNSRVQFIDARDLAEWTVRLVQSSQMGTFNAVASDPALTMGRVVTECVQAGGVGARPVWADEAFLLAQGLAPWTDLPLWLPTQTTDEYRGFHHIRSARAVAAGLTFRPLAQTINDTLASARSHGLTLPLKAGLSYERETAALRAWANR